MNDYQTHSIIGASLSSPIWVPAMENVNDILTMVLTFLGIVLTILKIYQIVGKKDDGE